MAVQSLGSTSLLTWSKFNTASTGNRSLVAPAYGAGIFGALGTSTVSYGQIIDSNNNMYVKHSEPITGAVVISKFSSSKDLLWAKKYEGFGATSIWGLSLAATTENPIFIARHENGTYYGAIEVSATDGTLLTTTMKGAYFTSYGVSPSQNKCGAAMSRTGNVYWGGDFNPGGVIAVSTMKMSPSGGYLAHTPGYVFNSDTRFDGAKEAPDGTVFIFYNAYTQFYASWGPVVSKHGSNLGQTWSKYLSYNSNSSEYIYGADVSDVNTPTYMSSNQQSSVPLLVAQLDANGNGNWARLSPAGIYPVNGGLVKDAAGNTYVLGRDSTTTKKLYLFKFDSSGNMSWQRSITYGDIINNGYAQMAISNDGQSVELIFRPQLFGTYHTVMASLPTDGSIIGQLTLGYYILEVAASSVSFTNVTPLNASVSPNTYSNNVGTNNSMGVTVTAQPSVIAENVREYF